jgi:hypothetical protein
MFYSTQILARKGPLGIVWIAAHLDGQLKRNQAGHGRGHWPATCMRAGVRHLVLCVRTRPMLNKGHTTHTTHTTPPQVFEASIPVTVDALMSSEAPLALRLTGQLMLGVVRIYARKVDYLHQVRARRGPGRGWAGCVRACFVFHSHASHAVQTGGGEDGTGVQAQACTPCLASQRPAVRPLPPPPTPTPRDTTRDPVGLPGGPGQDPPRAAARGPRRGAGLGPGGRRRHRPSGGRSPAGVRAGRRAGRQ